MALESSPNQAFLGSDTDDDFAALDSMAFTGTHSQFGMNAVTTPGISGGGSFGGSNNDDTPGNRIGDGRERGFTGVSESLFDRIRARTAEHQTQSVSSQPSYEVSSQQQQPPAQSSFQQSAFMSQQPSSEPTMEHEKIDDMTGIINDNNNLFGTAVAGAGAGAPSHNQNINTNNNNDETTYSFSATGAGENFSQAATVPHVPQYGPSRDDPYYAATASNQEQQHPSFIQGKAGMALAQTGETMKSLLGAGLSGAQAIGAMAQEKIGGGGGGRKGGERSYNNNFLLREDSLEEGSNMMNNTATVSQPPPPPAAVASRSETGAAASDQAYSMFSYGKTFCEDLIGFAMQLPSWGKGAGAVVLLWVLYVIFG